MKKVRKYLFVFCILFCFSYCKKEANNRNVSVTDNFVSSTVSSKYYLPSSTTSVIVRHKFYTLSYSEKHEQAEWVAYELKKSDVVYTNFRRPFFISDPAVKTGSAGWKNYIRSGYDRGHLCPAADRKFSKEAFNETFYTSNISPQKNDFNGGVWSRLEQKTRYWAKKYDGLYVVTGAVLTGDLKSIGKEGVSVPEYFYKILLDNNNGNYKAVGFLVPHKESNMPLYKFVVPIDKIEKLTGINFFPKLPDAVENRIEVKADYKDWSF
ncbi:DNA/RNA non-specific endonuclease [Flavobacterium sp. H122]|uniref:DNA/RNA non-specific endonuclease n=1 Tax=Flavobacterium sp. H122 TaxID=2529860 RepID=UPI0010AAAD49|nr:DNA/RNA non-specific endonuclease [Flavobacterium sp. H122]